MERELEHAKRRLLEHLAREISDKRVLSAMARVPREAFIPKASIHLAYEDIPLPIGREQTISQPIIVAMMTAALAAKETDSVLEIGTGSGYQAAVLSLLSRRVITVERFPELAERAEGLLRRLGYDNVAVRPAGEVLGCPEEAPFDGIMVTAGAPRLPRVLLDQMADGGRLVIPVGSQREQDLLLVKREEDGYTVKSLGPCRFVPLVGRGAWPQGETNGYEPFL
ncbi:MAG: protein-L-isoaspartate(D-aspartate) O-methyltransferase [Chloroflexi bacterium]|nr:protein-L-isoaspartate(D-aspartate) O-methyltransferase [Chloroflexota bacterium]